MQSERILNLRWDKFLSHITGSLDACYEKQQFVDVSLVCKDGTILKCHKMILANASNFFCHLLAANEHPHPMIILHDIDADDLKTIINFIYCGEIQVVESEVRRILRIANILQINGLTDIQTKPVVPPAEQRSFEVNTKTSEGIAKIPSPVRHIPGRPVKIPPDANKKFVPKKVDIPSTISVISSTECGKGAEERRRFAAHEGQPEGARPGTSKSPQISISKKRRESEPILDWNHVLKSIAKNDQSLKKLCIMNEVEITPGRSPAEDFQNFTFSDKRDKSSNDPSSDFEVIVVKDDMDMPYNVHELNMRYQKNTCAKTNPLYEQPEFQNESSREIDELLYMLMGKKL